MSAHPDDAAHRLRVVRRSSRVSPQEAISAALAVLARPRTMSTQRAISDALAAMQSEITTNATTTDGNFQTIVERLDALEKELTRMYWYILAPVLILAVIVGSLLTQKIIEIVAR